MPIGIIINSSAVFIGGLLGGYFGKWLKKDFCNNLTLIFGVCSMAMGIKGIVKMEQMPPVIFALILGTILGETIHLENLIGQAASALRIPIAHLFHVDTKDDDDTFIVEFISIVVLFCASGTGIFGALHSGITGDHSILITKAILDFFTAAIFAASLGYIVMAIAIPQCCIMLLLFFCASFIMPLTTDSILNNFTACGGILMLAAGFRIAGIKQFPIANMIPAMLFAMPFSALWTGLGL